MNDLDPGQRSDQQLAADLAAGDASATVELAQRYASDLYDFALRLTLDATTAVGVLENVFGRAEGEIAVRAAFLSVRAWLLGLAREEALDALAPGGSLDATLDKAATPLSADNPMFAAIDDASLEDLALLAWQAARSQRPADYSLLDLSLRRALPAQEVAEVAGLTLSGIHSVLGRLLSSFEESFAASLLFRLGRKSCAELDTLVAQARELRPALRRDISRHAESCANCKTTLNGQPPAADLFAVVANVELPAGLQAQIETALAGGTTPASEDLNQGPSEELELRTPRMPEPSVAGAVGGSSLLSELYTQPEEPESETLERPGVGPTLAGRGSETSQRSLHDELYGTADEQDGAPEGEESDEDRSVRDVPLTFTRGRSRPSDTQERIRFQREDLLGSSGGAGNRLGDMFRGGSGMWAIALLIGITLVAGYVGWAFGDSIQGSSDGGGLTSLPTRAGGVRALACGSGPVTVDQGSSATLSLDPKALNGYQVSSVSVHPVSPSASPQAVVAKTQGSNNVVFDALVVPGQAGTNEYKLSITLARGSDRVVSDCTVLVRAPTSPAAGQPTPAPAATTPAAATTPGAAGTPTPVRTAPPGSTATRVP